MSFITNPLVYYPISGILWFWHKILGFLGGLLPWVDAPDSNGVIWALSVIFLRSPCASCCSGRPPNRSASPARCRRCSRG